MAEKPPYPPPPPYNQTIHGESSAAHHVTSPPPATTARTGVQGPMVQGPDIAYLKSPPGIVKIVEAVVCLIGFIIDRMVYYPGGGFTSFSMINGFIQAIIWFVLRLVHAIPLILANYYIELIMCSIILLFLFVSFIVCAVYAWMHPAIGAICFFVVVAIFSYAVDVFFQVREIRVKFTSDMPQVPTAD